MRTTKRLELAGCAVLAMTAGWMIGADDDDRTPRGYRLVWADEFETDGPPNPKNWIFEQGFVRNNELQWYQPDNAFCEGGRLIIEGRGERKANPNYEEGSDNWRTNRQLIEYTSACVTTRKRDRSN